MDIGQLYHIDNLELLAKQVVEGFIIGLHKSPYHGFSVEFAEHRMYNSGESTRYIDWKVFARTDKMFVKRFEEETNLRCQIVIDSSSSMYFPDDNPGTLPVSKMRFSVVAAASMMSLLKKQRDAVGLSIFSEDIEVHTGTKTSTVHHRRLIAELQKLLDSDAKKKATEAAQSLHHIADSIHKRSLVIIFSDMLENMATWDSDKGNELFSALQHLRHNKHEVILFHVMDKQKELDFSYENRPYMFVDVETGEKVKLHPSKAKEFYRNQMLEFTKAMKLKCGQYKIDFVEADVNLGMDQILMPYLLKRSKMS